MVYELRCYTLTPGKMPEYLKAAETIGRPARGQNFGINHGYWTAEFGALSQIWHLWKYDSYEERSRLRGELAKNKAWTEGYVPPDPPVDPASGLAAHEPGRRHPSRRRYHRQRLRAAHLPDRPGRRPAIRRELQEGP